MSEFKYPIRAVSQLTGLSSDSIRSWERRYGAVKPERSKGGRLYSESDIRRLKLLKRAIDHGHSIGQIANLSDVALEHLPISREDPLKRSSPFDSKHTQLEVDAILSQIEAFDQIQADRTLGRLATILPPRDFVKDVVVPLMFRVGEGWKSGHMSVAQEHMVSASLRNILGTLVRLHTREDVDRRFLFATTQDELHEFGIMAAAMLTVAGGLGVIYLGANLPGADVAKAAKKTNSDAVVLGYAARRGFDEQRINAVDDIRGNLSDNIQIIVGGNISQKLVQYVNRIGAHHMDSFETYERFIRRYGARF